MLKRQHLQNLIDEHGHALIAVGGDETRAPFVYTVGLTARLGAELLIVGLSSGALVNQVADAMPLDLGVDLPQFANMPLRLVQCDAQLDLLHAYYVCQADLFYGKQVKVLQIVMPDRSVRFPEHPLYDHEYMDRHQPLFFSYQKRALT